MAVNKVVFGDQTLIDITDTVVDADTLPVGSVVYNAAGERTTGNAIVYNAYNGLDQTEAGYALDARQGKVLNDKIIALGDPVDITHGGTGATTPEGAKAALSLGTAAQNFTVSALSSSGQLIGMKWNVVNASDDLNGEPMLFIVASDGVGLYRQTTGQNGWLWNLRLPIAVTQGGTGATTPAAARANLEITPANIGAAVTSHTHDDRYYTESEIDTKLSAKSDTTHTHALSGDTLTGSLSVTKGGTGLSASPSMLVNLASTSSASVFQASPRPGVTGVLPVTNGGTGAADAPAARANLGIGNATQNFRIGTLSGNNQLLGALWNVDNANNTLNGAPVMMVVEGDGIGLYNQTEGENGWVWNMRVPISVSNGGTGATSAADARTALGITPANIGAATSGHTHDGRYYTETEVDTLLSEKSSTGHTHALTASSITGTLPVTKGGTGSTSASDARTALDVYSKSEVSGLIPSYGTSASAVGTTASAGSASSVSRSDHVHNIALATGDSDGQVKIAGTNVSVKGLASGAYSEVATMTEVNSYIDLSSGEAT